MTTIARRIAATATLAAATTISSPAVHPDKKDQTRSNQSWSARHRYHSNHR